jgi:hypothetical protein
MAVINAKKFISDTDSIFRPILEKVFDKMERTEQMASDIAEKLNGGEWKDGKWYADSHRKAWMDAVKPYADEIERLREALKYYADPKTYYEVGHIIGWDYGSIARAALKGDE